MSLSKCYNEHCPIISYELREWCPSCEHDEHGVDQSANAFEARCADLEANRFEEWAHGGKQDDWDEHYNMRDSITYNDAGEPMGYC